MNKFYVYALKDDDPDERSCYYVDVELIEMFAEKFFFPESLEFTGVIVEADDTKQAHVVYNTLLGGEILWAEEPTCTALKRKIFEAKNKILEVQNKTDLVEKKLTAVEQKGALLALGAMSKQISGILIDLNDRLSFMARIARSATQAQKDMTPEQAYERIKSEYIKFLQESKYIPPSR